MKKIVIAAMCIFAIEGQAATEKAPSVGQNMKAMGKVFKQLKADVSNSAKNAGSLLAAKELLRLYKVSMEQAREGAAVVTPANQLDAATADYQKILQLGLADSESLVKALEANDNDGAKRFVDKLRKNETEGHDKFKKD